LNSTVATCIPNGMDRLFLTKILLALFAFIIPML
jgi:hypothetical protein